MTNALNAAFCSCSRRIFRAALSAMGAVGSTLGFVLGFIFILWMILTVLALIWPSMFAGRVEQKFQ
jgi:hypothetical protein